jgi:hypothetical protein
MSAPACKEHVFISKVVKKTDFPDSHTILLGSCEKIAASWPPQWSIACPVFSPNSLLPKRTWGVAMYYFPDQCGAKDTAQVLTQLSWALPARKTQMALSLHCPGAHVWTLKPLDLWSTNFWKYSSFCSNASVTLCQNSGVNGSLAGQPPEIMGP